MTSYWKCNTSKITNSFHALIIVFNVKIKNEDCEEATVEQISAKHQKTSADQETNEDDTTECEQVTKLGNLFISCRKTTKTALHLH
jgi:hypothetical protein